MERSSRVLHHGKPEMWNFNEINEIEFCPYPEFPYAEKRNRLRQYQSYISNWCQWKGLHEYYYMGTKKFDFFFQESSKLNSTCILTCAEELKSFK